MKIKLIVLVSLLTGASLLLSGCVTGLAAASWPAVSADAERAYVAAGSFVYAVDLRNGTELWRFPEKASPANPFYAVPALTPDGQLIITGFDHKLYSLDPLASDENRVNWTFSGAKDRYYASALVANEMIYAANADYTLYALDLRGNLQWSFAAEQSIWAAPVSDGQRVYFGALDRKVYALDARSGEKVWEKELSAAVLSSPLLGEGGVLYVSVMNGEVYALQAETGQPVWRRPFQAQDEIWSTPVLMEGNLYFGDLSGFIYAVAADSGQEAQPRLQAGGAILSSPLHAQGRLAFATEDGSLFYVDPRGETQTVTISGMLYGSPASAGALVLVAPEKGSSTLVALDADGVQKWVFDPEN